MVLFAYFDLQFYKLFFNCVLGKLPLNIQDKAIVKQIEESASHFRGSFRVNVYGEDLEVGRFLGDLSVLDEKLLVETQASRAPDGVALHICYIKATQPGESLKKVGKIMALELKCRRELVS